jgi:hypothetical protein
MIDIAHDERVIVIVRRHWFVLLMESLGVIFLFFLPFLLLLICRSSFGAEIFSMVHLPIIAPSTIIFLTAFWLLIIWFRLFSIWTSYYLDKWVITNKRIVTINQVDFFNRDVSNFRIDNGDITIQTAGELGDFTMVDVPSPAKLKELITHQQDVVAKEFKPIPDSI